MIQKQLNSRTKDTCITRYKKPKFEKLNLESKIQAAKVESSITSLRCMTNIMISQVYNRLKVDSIPSSSMRLQG